MPSAVGLTVQDRQRLDAPVVPLPRTDAVREYGCIWDGPNYSCPFDSMFMATFSMYRHAGPSWRREWCKSSDFNRTTAGFFDHILTTMRTPSVRRQLPSLFNTYRDRVRHYLSTTNAGLFPRFGQNDLAVSDIFVQMYRFDGDPRLVRLKFSCSDPSHQTRTKGDSLTFVLLQHTLDGIEPGPNGGPPMLQRWVSSYLSKLKTEQPLCRTCHIPCLYSSSSFTPLPWIWIDISPESGSCTPSIALTLEQDSGPNTDYTLISIIYSGQNHFSARWRDASGRWWAHDGMVGSGRPSLDPIAIDAQLARLGPRVMHILIYRLDSADSTVITDST